MSFTIVVMAWHVDRFATLSRGTHKPIWGVEAAEAVLQTLLIFSAPSNRIAIEQEISFLSSLRPGDPMTSAEKKHACELMGADVVYLSQATNITAIMCCPAMADPPFHSSTHAYF